MKKNAGRKASKQCEEELQLLEEVKNKKSGGNVRMGLVRRLVPNFRWAIPNRHVDHNEGGEDAGKFVGQVKIKRKTREQQMRPYRRFQTPELTITMIFASYVKIAAFGLVHKVASGLQACIL
ncbi:Protein BEX4 [Lemmus lemmus]